MLNHLKQQAISTPSDMKDLYNSVLQHAEGSAIKALSFEAAKQAMKRARDKLYPKNIQEPAAVTEFLEQRSSQVSHYYHKTIVMNIDDHDERIIILFSPELIDHVDPLTVCYLFDATFKTSPRSFYQVFNVCADIQGTVAPLFCCLMTRKTHEMYVAVLEEIKASFPQLDPQEAMSDFEWGLMLAIHKTFPLADLAGCNFHSGDAFLRKMRSPGTKHCPCFYQFHKSVA